MQNIILLSPLLELQSLTFVTTETFQRSFSAVKKNKYKYAKNATKKLFRYNLLKNPDNSKTE